MVLNLVRKGGVPALAYSSTDAPKPWQCSLILLCSEIGTQFTVLLEASVFIHGFDDKQSFVLRFDGDNFVPGKISFGHSDISLSAGLMNSIARKGQPKFQMLSLTLKAHCSVWYPRTLSSAVPPLGTPSHELVVLAKTTEIHILFDSRWLGRNLSQLQSVSQSSSQLSGVPVHSRTIYAQLYLQGDWSILNYTEDAKPEGFPLAEGAAPDVVPSVEDAVGDAPPPYESSKRLRNTCTPDLPLSKRRLQDSTCPPSRTERATSASSSTTVEVDIFKDAVTSAVQKVLPDILRDQIPSILGNILSSMFDSPSPSPSPSRQIATALAQSRSTPSHKLTPAAALRAVVSTHTETHIEKLITNAMNEIHDQASQIYDSANVEFAEDLDDHQLSMAEIKENLVADFNRECDECLGEKLDEFKERMAGMKERVEEEVEEYAEKVAGKVCAWCWCKRSHGAKDELKQGRRATSLPL